MCVLFDKGPIIKYSSTWQKTSTGKDKLRSTEDKTSGSQIMTSVTKDK